MRTLLGISLLLILVTTPQLIEAQATPTHLPHRHFAEHVGDSIMMRTQTMLYSHILNRLKEPVLYENPLSKTTYRLLIVRSLSTVSKTVLTLERSGDYCWISWKECGHFCENVDDSTDLVSQGSKTIDRRHWDHFESMLSEIDFWQTPVIGGSRGWDGSEWILEGRKGDTHHVVIRWTPHPAESGISYKEVCDYLLTLAGLL